MASLTSARAFKFATALAVGFALAACAKGSDDLSGAAAGAPGSLQDFTANVGDRVFFDTDSSELTPTAQGTLDRQAGWLSK